MVSSGPPIAPAPLVRLDGVGHDFDGSTVLDGVDLTVEPGAFLGVVGPSGAGKTTLLRILLGMITPTQGTVQRSPGLTIGYVPQVEAIDWAFPVTVGEVAMMGRPQTRLRPWARPDERAAAADLLDRLGLGGLDHRHIGDLSGGQAQRVFVARALLQGAELLVLDEPTAGIDVGTRHELLHLLGDLHRDARLTIVLTTHDLNGLAAHLPHLICLNRHVIATGAPIDVLTPATLEQTFGASLDVLVHAGLPVVLDAHQHRPHQP